MAYMQIPNLPATIALNGSEQLEVVQNGTSVRATTAQVAALAFSLAPTFTNITTPIVYGGINANSTLTLQSTSGVGTSDSILFKVGNNGATTAMQINTSGGVGIGPTTPGATNLLISKNATGGATSYIVYNTSIAQSDVTSSVSGFVSNVTLNTNVTTGNMNQFFAAPSAARSGSSVSSSTGFYAGSSIGTSGAATVTTAIGFSSNLASGTNRWNLYAGGSAPNYMAGGLGIGTTSLGGTGLTTDTIWGGTAVSSTLTIQSTSGAGTTDSILFKVGNAGAITALTINTTGAVIGKNSYKTSPQTATDTATLSAAQILSSFLIGTPTATASYTLPLGTAVDTALGTPAVGTNWEFTVFTTAAFAITLLTATGWTLVGSMATGASANSFARFLASRTGTGTYSLYRIS